LAEAKTLIQTTGYPYFVTSMGKGSVPENLPTFGGIYGGMASFPETRKAVESSDCFLWLGNYPVS
jgi:pyruvate decarboxylase